MYDSKGITIGVLGIGRDITDRKRSEERLRQSENQYRTLIQSMPDGVYRSTPEGKFIEVNDAMVRILGYDSKEDLMSIDIKSQLYFDSEERESLTKKMRLNELDVFPLRKKDGTIVYIEDHGWLVTDENDNIIFHEGVSRDVTQRKIAEVQLQEYSEQLKELVATKDKFFSIIAHDLKSPFNSILGLSEIIKNDARYLDIATIEQYAGIIYSTSNNTFRLLENLLDWARIQQSQMPFQPASLILKTIANEVIELSIEKANSKIIAIINYIPDNLIVMADRNMLNTILRNLISNALKFTSANGKVGIKAITKGNTTEISVEDTGTGIKQEDISKIFEIGSSFSKRGTENEKGTGLGLLLCKEFVEKHGGHIWVESEEGKGSTFFFTINNSESLTK
jgi:PAS domain S-box-containing protein